MASAPIDVPERATDRHQSGCRVTSRSGSDGSKIIRCSKKKMFRRPSSSKKKKKKKKKKSCRPPPSEKKKKQLSFLAPSRGRDRCRL
jgi:hypothetical protein